MHRPTLAFAAWTLLVWAGRIRNAVDGNEGTGAIVLAATFVLGAVAVLATRGRVAAVVVALAAWTTAVWVVRAIDIAFLSDRSAGFVAVHLVLAAVSIGLAGWATRCLTRSGRARQPVAG